jgi:RHS repeat-associated protein
LEYYCHADWLGSAKLTSTPSRTVSGDVAYAPFGETYAASGSPDVSFAFSASRMNLRDTGQNPDTNANLYDFMYREYGIQGRWPSPDPLRSGAFNLAEPQSLNLYAYVRNTPMTQVDPLGLTSVGVCNTWGTKLRIGPMPSCILPAGGGGEGPPDDGCGIDGGFGPCSLGGDGYASAICPDNDCGFGSPAGEYQCDAAGNCGYGRFNDIGLAPPSTPPEGDTSCIEKGLDSTFTGATATVGSVTSEVGGHWGFNFEMQFNSASSLASFNSLYDLSAQNGVPPPARFGPGPALHMENVTSVWIEGIASGNVVVGTVHIDLFNPNNGATGKIGHVTVDGLWGHITQLFGGNIDPRTCPF